MSIREVKRSITVQETPPPVTTTEEVLYWEFSMSHYGSDRRYWMTALDNVQGRQVLSFFTHEADAMQAIRGFNTHAGLLNAPYSLMRRAVQRMAAGETVITMRGTGRFERTRPAVVRFTTVCAQDYQIDWATLCALIEP